MYTIQSNVGTITVENGKLQAESPELTARLQKQFDESKVSSKLEPDPDYTDAMTIAYLVKGKVLEKPKPENRPVRIY